MLPKLHGPGACLLLLAAGLCAAAAEPPAPAPERPGGESLLTPPAPDPPPAEDPFVPAVEPIFRLDRGAPLGFAGPSGIVPREQQADSHFVPVEDRWRVPFPSWDRYG